MNKILNMVVLSLCCLFALCCNKDNSTQPPTVDLTTGLVAYYPFNGNANDESGNGLSGVVNGATLTTDRFGNANKAYWFDGDSNEVQVPHSDALNITGDITLSAWFNSTEAPLFRTSHTILTKRLPNTTPAMTSNFPYLLCVNYQYGMPANYRKPLFVSAVNPTYQYLQSTSDVNIVAWNHIVSIVKNNNLRIFLNGIVIKDTTINNQLRVGNTGPLLIGSGARIDKPAEQFKGQIDDIRIYSRALTDNEIQALYHEGGWTGNHDVVAYYPFNGNANDESGNSQNGVVNGATLATDRFGNVGKAYSFNGNTSYIDIANNNFLPQGSSPRTISAWIKVTPHNNQVIADWGSPTLHQRSCLMVWGVTNGDFFSTFADDLPGTRNVTDNNWHHLVGLYDGTNLSLYVDAQYDTTKSVPLNTQGNHLALGRRALSDATTEYLLGLIDDVRIYGRELSLLEIRALYHEGGW